MSFMAAPSDETLRGRWKWFVGIGIVLVIVGLIALANVVDATLITTVIVGIALVFGGAMQLIGAWAAEGSTGRRALMAILGVLYIIVGFNLIADPLRGTVGLTIVVALFLIIDGVLKIFSALVPGDTEQGDDDPLRHRDDHPRRLALVGHPDERRRDRFLRRAAAARWRASSGSRWD